jgi:prolyl-tRNA synthetase
MRITQAYFRTEKNAPSGARSDSYRLLYRGGFIRPTSEGRFALLPIGLRVQKHILEIIEQELRALEAQPIRLPVTFLPLDDSSGAKNKAPSKLEGSHDEAGDAAAADLFVSLRPSYKDLPVRFFQFIIVPRSQINAREGLIQDYEFSALESYLFEPDERSLEATLTAFGLAYERIFKKLGLEPVQPIIKSGSRERNPVLRYILITPQVSERLDLYWDEREELLAIEEIDCATNYRAYRSILKFYAEHPEKTLKNLLYRIDEKKDICITIRGDYKIDLNKLKKELHYSLIRPLTEDEVKGLGSFPGFISALGLKKDVRVLVDESVRHNKNYWDGGNKELAFKKNVNFERDFGPRETVDVREDKVGEVGGDKIFLCDRCGYKAGLEEAEFERESVNLDQEMKDFMIIDQPEWVCTMDDMVRHYKEPRSHFLKNVVYKDPAGRLIIAVVRGELEASPEKIANILGCGNLRLAEEEDFERLQIQAGWVHSWGHDKGRRDVVYVGDESLRVSRNLIGGHKEATCDAFHVNYGRDFKCTLEGDIAKAHSGVKCKHCADGYLKERKGIELGQLSKHSPSGPGLHKVPFIDKEGKEKEVWRGVSRIDLDRIISAVVELHHDDRGIIWPRSVAPYLSTLVSIGRTARVMEESERIYKLLKALGQEVLWDDREDVSPGEKLMDADLIGNPLRLVVSDRTLKENRVEIKHRSGDEAVFIELVEKSLIAALENLEKSLAEKGETSLKTPRYNFGGD